MLDGKKIETGTGYTATSFSQTAGWAVDETKFPHYLSSVRGRWKKVPKIGPGPKKEIQSIAAAGDGNCWAGTRDEDLYYFDRSVGSWKLVRRQSFQGGPSPQSLFLRSSVEAGDVFQQTQAVSTAGSTTDGSANARGFRLRKLVRDEWYVDTEIWAVHAIINPIDETIIAMTRDGGLYRRGSFGGWTRSPLTDNQGRKEYEARDIAASNGNIYALLPNRNELYIQFGTRKGFHRSPRVNNTLPFGIFRAPQRFGIGLHFGNHGIRFWDTP